MRRPVSARPNVRRKRLSSVAALVVFPSYDFHLVAPAHLASPFALVRSRRPFAERCPAASLDERFIDAARDL